MASFVEKVSRRLHHFCEPLFTISVRNIVMQFFAFDFPQLCLWHTVVKFDQIVTNTLFLLKTFFQRLCHFCNLSN
jgi:hypothetical protein